MRVSLTRLRNFLGNDELDNDAVQVDPEASKFRDRDSDFFHNYSQTEPRVINADNSKYCNSLRFLRDQYANVMMHCLNGLLLSTRDH